MSLQFMAFYRAVRSTIQDPMSFDWVLHTSVGPIHMLRLQWDDAAAVLCIHSHDEVGAYKFLAFTDAQLLHFPLEVRKKESQKRRAPIGFNVSAIGEDVTSFVNSGPEPERGLSDSEVGSMRIARVDIDTANAMKRFIEGSASAGPQLRFTCCKCEQTVSVHKDGQPGQGPHFEHLAGNPRNCRK